MKRIAQATMPFILGLVPLVFAAAALPPGVPTGQAITLSEIIGLVNRLVQLLTTIGVVLGVGFIVFGGIEYMRAGGDAEKAKTATARIKNGLIGVGIILGVGVLIETVGGIVNRSFFNG